MTAAIRIPTHTLSTYETFGTDLSVAARAGLTGGLTLANDPAIDAEIAYRRERVAVQRARRAARRDRDDGDGNPRAHRAGTVTRWISWLQSDRRHRSSAAHAS
jgi:hypothetical protein